MSSAPQNYPKSTTNHLEPPKDAQNLQNPSKIEDFRKSSWIITILDLPSPRTSKSGYSCWIACNNSQYPGSWSGAQIHCLAHFCCLLPQSRYWVTRVPGRAARSDQPKSLLYVYNARVFNAGTGLGWHIPSILHETALAVIAEIEPGHPRILLRLEAPAI